MDPESSRIYGAYILTGIVCGLFAASLIVVFYKNDQTLLNIVIGAIVAKFSDIVSYWTGSSASSAQKDQQLANQAGRSLRPPPGS